MNTIKLKFYFCLIFIFIHSNIGFAQAIKNISLPNKHSTSLSKPTNTSRTLNVYITNNHEVYLEKQKMMYWDNIISTLMNVNREWGYAQTLLSNVMIHCDLRVKYRFLDRVKEELARSNKKTFLYKVGSPEANYYNIDVNHGTIKEKWTDEMIRTRQNEFDSITIDHIKKPAWLTQLEPDLVGQQLFEFRNNLYNLEKEKIEQSLEIIPHEQIILLPGKKYYFSKKVWSNDEIQQLIDLVQSGYILFIKFDFNMDYSDYIDFLQKRSTSYNKTKLNLNRSGLFVEVSHSLEKELKRLSIKLSN